MVRIRTIVGRDRWYVYVLSVVALRALIRETANGTNQRPISLDSTSQGRVWRFAGARVGRGETKAGQTPAPFTCAR